EKLFEISSTNFGNKMIEFYQDTLIYFDQLQMEKENADSIKKIKVKFTSLRK
ncbi:glycosyltransferase family 4 protein, partial [Enterococcus faecalis]|nr:glycosyltransferase family 4 protein [Enterococcus faecalis]NST28428.1 glycosyltransferase family 4 protein [Enterococcus faecalis]